jgi:hypothetical protein
MSVAKIGTEFIAKTFSKILNEKEANEMTMTTAQELLLEGKAEGLVEGEAKAIMTILRTRFSEVPKGIENAIRQMTDSIALESLTVHALHSKTLDEFATALQ